MKFIEGIVTSFQGNAKEKLNDPLIGSFVFSFILWNWSHFLLLFFGDKYIDYRILDCMSALKLSFESFGDFFNSLLIYLVPFLASIFYVFVMPRISLYISKTLNPLEILKHEKAVELEVKRVENQLKLNKQKLLSDPNKEFLTELIKSDQKKIELQLEKQQADTNTQKDIAAKAKAEREIAEAGSKKVKDNAAKAQAERELAEVNLKNVEAEKVIIQKKSEYERKKLSVGVAITNSMLKANAYSSSFNFVRLLSESLVEDHIVLTHKSLTEIVAAVFGYKNFDSLLSDTSFNNESLSKLKYILLDSEKLGSRLEEILSEDIIDDEIFNTESLFDHLTMMFETLPYLYGDEDVIADAVYEGFENDVYGLLDANAVTSAISEVGAGDLDIELTEKRYEREVENLKVIITAHGSGTHYKNSDISVRGIDITVEVTVPVLWGAYGLGEYSVNVTASPETYDDDWDMEEAEMENE